MQQQEQQQQKNLYFFLNTLQKIERIKLKKNNEKENEKILYGMNILSYGQN